MELRSKSGRSPPGEVIFPSAQPYDFTDSVRLEIKKKSVIKRNLETTDLKELQKGTRLNEFDNRCVMNFKKSTQFFPQHGTVISRKCYQSSKLNVGGAHYLNKVRECLDIRVTFAHCFTDCTEKACFQNHRTCRSL